MNIPFADIKTPTARVKTAYLRAVERILSAGHFILTEEVTRFEHEFAAAVKSAHCVGVSSGADALYVALLALGVGAGDEVITQGNAYNASVTAVLRTGATVRFADIIPETLTIDPARIEPLINSKTAAILPVHLYGQPADMTSIMAVARKHGLPVVEDCAQSHLATWNKKTAGTFGRIGCFSFYPTKNLGAFGDAGAIVTDNDSLADKIRALRNLGQTAKNVHTYLGFNLRLDPIQAAGLSLKLQFLKAETKKRQAGAARYDKLLAPFATSVMPLSRNPRAVSVHHLYPVKLLREDRDRARDRLMSAGIETAVHYPVPVYRQPFYRGPADPCPITDLTSAQILSLPFFPDISRKQQKYVVEKLISYDH